MFHHTKKPDESLQPTGDLGDYYPYYDDPYGVAFAALTTTSAKPAVAQNPTTDSAKNQHDKFYTGDDDEDLLPSTPQTKPDAKAPANVEDDEKAKEEVAKDKAAAQAKAETAAEAEAEAKELEARTVADVRKEFMKLSEFGAFQKWYGGKLNIKFQHLCKQLTENFNQFEATELKDIIIIIKNLANSVVRHDFSRDLGNELVALYNALTHFFNFITSGFGERTRLIVDRVSKGKLSFESLNETAEYIQDMSLEDFQQIREVFPASITDIYDNHLSITYHNIQKRIESLSEMGEIADLSKSTEKNLDIVHSLQSQGLVPKDWKWEFEPENIVDEKSLDVLKNSILGVEKIAAHAIKNVSEKQQVKNAVLSKETWKEGLSPQVDSLKEFFQNIKSSPFSKETWSEGVRNQIGPLKKFYKSKREGLMNKSELKIWFESLKKDLEQAYAELEQYTSMVLNNPEKILMIKMSEILCPVLDKFLLLQEKGVIEAYGEGGNTLKSNLQTYASTFTKYLHDPKSVGLENRKFQDKADILNKPGGEKALYAYYLAQQDKENTKLAQKKAAEDELINLLTMEQILADEESVNLEGNYIKQHQSRRNRDFDFKNIGAAYERHLGGESDKYADDNQSVSETSNNKGIDEKTFKEYKIMLRVIDVIAKKFGVEPTGIRQSAYDNSGYRFCTSSKSVDLLGKLGESREKSKQEKIIGKILDFAHNFAEDFNVKNEGVEKPEVKQEKTKSAAKPEAVKPGDKQKETETKTKTKPGAAKANQDKKINDHDVIAYVTQLENWYDAKKKNPQYDNVLSKLGKRIKPYQKLTDSLDSEYFSSQVTLS